MREEDIERICAQFAEKFPPLITFNQAAAIGQLPKGTIEDYSSRGLFGDFKIRFGKRCLLDRDQFVRFVLTRETQLAAKSQAVIPSTTDTFASAPPPCAESRLKMEKSE